MREWEAKLAPILADELRQRRWGKGGARSRQWHVDETYLKVGGRWAYLYRAIDRDGNLVDTMLSEHRDMAAAQAFFRSAKATTGVTPDQVTTDGHGSYPRAIRSTLGRHVVHRTSAYKNNRLEQDHRGVKRRIRCMRGFKNHHRLSRLSRLGDAHADPDRFKTAAPCRSSTRTVMSVRRSGQLELLVSNGTVQLVAW